MSLVMEFVEQQRAIGGDLREEGGLLYAASYGDPEGELRACREGVGVLWQPWRAYLRVVGEERLSFLHRLLTADLQKRQPGDHAPSLLLDNRGKVQASLDLWIEDDGVLIGADRTVVDRVVEGLRRYVLRSALQVDHLPLASFALLGPGQAAAATALGLAPAAPGEPGEGRGWRSLQTGRLPGGLEIAAPEPMALDLWQAMCGGMADDVHPMGRVTAEVLRVEAGIPAHGAELSGNVLPQEARLETAVDFEKGCYLGQETVARIHYRGHVNRLLCGLRSARAVEPGATLSSGGREAGTVTSAVISDQHGPIGLGYIRRERAEPGTDLQASDGSTVSVARLPFDVAEGIGAAAENA